MTGFQLIIELYLLVDNLHEHAWNERRCNLHIRRQGNYSANSCFCFFPLIYSRTWLRDETISVTPQYVKSLGRLSQTPTPCCRDSQHTVWAPLDGSLNSTPPDLLGSHHPLDQSRGGAECQGIWRNGTANPHCQVIPKLISWYFLLIGLVCLFLSFSPFFFSSSSSGMRNYTICKQNAAFHHHPLFVCITFFGAWTERSGVASVAAIKRPFSGPIFFTHPSFVVCALIVVVCVFSDAIVSQECQNSLRMKSKSLDKNGLTETIFPTPTCIY